MSAANILAFHQLNNLPNAHLEYCGDIEDAFYLKCKNGKIVKFSNNRASLYIYRYSDKVINEWHNGGSSFAQYFQLASDYEKFLSKKEVRLAKKARKIQQYLGWLSTDEFLRIAKDHRIEN